MSHEVTDDVMVSVNLVAMDWDYVLARLAL